MSVFTNCNACGIRLRTEDEDKMGMCERCAQEPIREQLEGFDCSAGFCGGLAPKVMEPTVSAGPSPGPQTHEEAVQFNEGFLAGLTAYAREKGESTLTKENELLRRLANEQGWKTIETFERIAFNELGAADEP